MEMVIPSHKDWDPPIEAQTKILLGGMTTIVDDDDVEAMHPSCSAVELVQNLWEATEVANGKATTHGASLEGVPPKIGKPKLAVDLGHTNLHGIGGETVNDHITNSPRPQEPAIPPFPSNFVEKEFDSTLPQDPAATAQAIIIDGFIASISKSIPAPLISQIPEAIAEEEPNDIEMGNTPEPPQTPPPPRPSVFTPQRKSIRLAKKYETT
jgi:hypothetical protein